MSIVGDDHLDILEHPETDHMSQAGTSKVSVGCHGDFGYDQSSSKFRVMLQIIGTTIHDD